MTFWCFFDDFLFLAEFAAFDDFQSKFGDLPRSAWIGLNRDFFVIFDDFLMVWTDL